MVTPDRVNFLFADARSLYDDAIEMLDQGKIRNAAEKAWARHEAGHRRPGPGKARGRAAIGRTGTARSFAAERPGSGVRHPARAISHQGRVLHINCFYDGNCEPEQEMAGLIRATILYIDLAERLSEE